MDASAKTIGHDAIAPGQTYSDLEVIHGVTDHGKQVAYDPSPEQYSRWAESEHSVLPHATHLYAMDDKFLAPTYQKRLRDHGDEARLPVGAKNPMLCGLPRKKIWIILGLAVFIVLAAAVGGGVGGSLASRRGGKASTVRGSGGESREIGKDGEPKSSPAMLNSSIAAVTWEDDEGTHTRVYWQDKQGVIQESAVDDATTKGDWTISPVTRSGGNAKPGTPISVGVGYPIASKQFLPVLSVFFLDDTDQIHERQNPYQQEVGAWGNENFSGLYKAQAASRITTYWQQDLDNATQTLLVLFQEADENGVSIGHYKSDKGLSYEWVKDRQPDLKLRDGAPTAWASVGTSEENKKIALYVTDGDGKLTQYMYNFDTNKLLGDASSTNFVLGLATPFFVAIQDFQTDSDRAPTQCIGDSPKVHLILYAAEDGSSLSLVTWNCADGFVQSPDKLKDVLKTDSDRKYLGLSGTQGDNKLYVIFDAGDGPEIEQWEMTLFSNEDPWKVVGKVPVKYE